MTLHTIWLVLRKPGYGILASCVAVFMFILGVLLPHYQLIKQILANDFMRVTEKLIFIVSLLGAIQTNFTLVSGITLIITAVLFGINIALLVYYIRQARRGRRSLGVSAGATTFSGLVSSIFGIGCAACGSLIATSILVTLGAGGFLMLLPLRGVEFGFIGIGLIMYAVWMLAKKINEPMVCDVV